MTTAEALGKAFEIFGKHGRVQSDGVVFQVGVFINSAFTSRGIGATWEAAIAAAERDITLAMRFANDELWEKKKPGP